MSPAVGGAVGQQLHGYRPTPVPKTAGDIFELMGESRWGEVVPLEGVEPGVGEERSLSMSPLEPTLSLWSSDPA